MSHVILLTKNVHIFFSECVVQSIGKGRVSQLHHTVSHLKEKYSLGPQFASRTFIRGSVGYWVNSKWELKENDWEMDFLAFTVLLFFQSRTTTQLTLDKIMSIQCGLCFHTILYSIIIILSDPIFHTKMCAF